MNTRDDKFDTRCTQWKTKWDTLSVSPGFRMLADTNTAKILTLLADYACYSESAITSSLVRLFNHPKRHYAAAVTAVISDYYIPEKSLWNTSNNHVIEPWFTNSSATIEQVLASLKQKLGTQAIKPDGDLSALLFVIRGETKVDFEQIPMHKSARGLN